jgi:hypothetical protein
MLRDKKKKFYSLAAVLGHKLLNVALRCIHFMDAFSILLPIVIAGDPYRRASGYYPQMDRDAKEPNV